MDSVFTFDNYREYLRAFFKASGSRSGLKSKLAKAAQIQSAYLSKILKGETDLNLEQALRVANFLSFNSDELDFFMLLLEKERAATSELQDYFNKKIKDLSSKRSQIKSRITADDALSVEEKTQYYSDWSYSAIHMALDLPYVNSLKEISELLNIKLEEAGKALEFLIGMGLVIGEEGKLSTSRRALHLPGDSPLIIQHHRNWRLKAMQDIKPTSSNNMHFSAVMTLDKQTYQNIRRKILDLIDASISQVQEAESEDVYTFNIDWYKL